MQTTKMFIFICAIAMAGCHQPSAGKTTPKKSLPVTLESGEALLEQGDYEQAVQIFSNLLEQTPDNGYLQYYAGLANRHLEQLDTAKTHYSKALEIMPQLEEARVNLGLLHLELGELDEAHSLLEVHANSHQDEADAHYNLALVLEAQDDLKGAHEHYLRSSKIDPRDPSPMLGLGDVSKKRKKTAKALEYYDRAIALDQSFSQGHLARGELLMEQGNTDKAAEAMMRLETLGDAESATLAGIILAKNKRESEAKRLYEAALTFEDASVTTNFLLANLLARQGNFEPAIKHFEKFISQGSSPEQIAVAKKRLEVCKQKTKK